MLSTTPLHGQSIRRRWHMSTKKYLSCQPKNKHLGVRLAARWILRLLIRRHPRHTPARSSTRYPDAARPLCLVKFSLTRGRSAPFQDSITIRVLLSRPCRAELAPGQGKRLSCRRLDPLPPGSSRAFPSRPPLQNPAISMHPAGSSIASPALTKFSISPPV